MSQDQSNSESIDTATRKESIQMRKIVQYTLIPCGIIGLLLAIGNDHSGWLQCFVGINATLILVLVGLLIEEHVRRVWQASLAEHVQSALHAHEMQQQQSQRANQQNQV